MATNFDLRITRQQAEEILAKGLDVKNEFQIMCKEYGDDDDWVGLEAGDLDDEGNLNEEWQTLEIWFKNQ